ncbi:bcl-2-like protein 13 [Channa argus]|nr:hypothetical protein Q8A73_021926 [Channa argus]
MGDADPEDTKSLDSSDGAALAGEENHSSNSDMVHLEREEAEMLEEAEKEAAEEEKVKRTEEEEDEDDELQTSVLSVLGGEKELVELREDEEDLQAPDTELPVSAEERHVEKEPAGIRQVPPVTLPPLPIVRLDPPSTTSTPVPSTTSSEVEELYSTQGLLPPSILTLMAAEPPVEELEQHKFSQVPLSDVEEHSVKESPAAVEKTEPRSTVSETRKPLSSTGLLCGGAALVAVVGVVAYGAVAYCRK